MAHILVFDLTRSSDTVDELIAAINVADPRLAIKAVDAAAFDDDEIRIAAKEDRAHLVVLLGDADSIEPRIVPMLRAVSREPGGPAVVVAAPWQSAAHVSAVLAHGARDVLALPLHVAEAAGRLRVVLQDAAKTMSIVDAPVPGLVGENATFLAELRKIPVVAKCDANVLIQGETGTGKELCAHAIHRASARHQKPFVPINCGAIPQDLLENELFGHERGAFTGASQGRPGLVQEADGGTLFLDEINSLPLSAQVKLLRVLQDGSFRALGSNRVQRVDLRIVSAANEDLHGAVQDGRFRKDLYYRLNVIPIRLPALRERRDDIPRLARLFLARYAERMGKRMDDLTPDALTRLSSYDWPGNVRELEHVVERAVVLASSSRVRACDLSFGADDTADANSFQEAKARVVRDFERGYLRSVLGQCCGNISQAALAAGKDRRAFWELLRKHAIDPGEFRGRQRMTARRLAS